LDTLFLHDIILTPFVVKNVVYPIIMSHTTLSNEAQQKILSLYNESELNQQNFEQDYCVYLIIYFEWFTILTALILIKIL
jgi:hypothetical protein